MSGNRKGSPVPKPTWAISAFTRHLPNGYPVLHTCLMQIADLSDDDPLKVYLRELATVQPLTSDEASGLLKQIRSDSDRAVDAEKV
jgi:hypothetical protein